MSVRNAVVTAMAIAAVMSGPAHAADITYEPMTGGKGIIILDGEIVKGDAAKLRRLAAAHDASGIILSSEGGSLGEALEIGQVVSIAGYGTAVPNGFTCASSCALIWLAGNRRLAGRTARVGFHAGYVMEDGKPIQSGVGNAMVGRYLTQLNMPATAVIFATSARPDQMAWIDTANPGAEGIEYTVMDKDAPTARAATTTTSRASTQPVRDRSPLNDKTFGKWSTAVGSRGVSAYTVQRTEPVAGTDGLSLDMKCFIGTKCRFSLTFLGGKDGTGCEPGDSYGITYQVEGYERKSVQATCEVEGDTMVLGDTDGFGTDISNETNVTVRMNTDTGIRAVSFSLIGFDQAVTALRAAGYVKNGMGARP